VSGSEPGKADPADEGPTTDGGASVKPDPAPTTYQGRATARIQPNRGRLLDDSPEFDGETYDPGRFDGPASAGWRRVPAPLVIGAVIAAVIATTVVVILETSSAARCPATGCAAARTPSAGHPSPGETATTTASPGLPSSTPRQVVGTVPPLASVMPADVNLRTCRTKDNQPFLDDVTAFYACQETAGARIPYLQVWGYQFPDQAAYLQGVDAFNAFVKFDPGQAEGKCPPAATYGRVGWHTLADPDTDAGTLECYSDSAENHYYVWTDDVEYTIMVAESGPEHAFADLDAWWRENNRNA
jgi:hypothetical protein